MRIDRRSGGCSSQQLAASQPASQPELAATHSYRHAHKTRHTQPGLLRPIIRRQRRLLRHTLAGLFAKRLYNRSFVARFWIKANNGSFRLVELYSFLSLFPKLGRNHRLIRTRKSIVRCLPYSCGKETKQLMRREDIRERDFLDFKRRVGHHQVEKASFHNDNGHVLRWVFCRAAAGLNKRRSFKLTTTDDDIMISSNVNYQSGLRCIEAGLVQPVKDNHWTSPSWAQEKEGGHWSATSYRSTSFSFFLFSELGMAPLIGQPFAQQDASHQQTSIRSVESE